MESRQAKTRSGRKVFVAVLNEDEMSEHDTEGMCISCGNFQGGVEPDARQYECESCQEKDVYGIEELVIMGYVRIEGEE